MALVVSGCGEQSRLPAGPASTQAVQVAELDNNRYAPAYAEGKAPMPATSAAAAAEVTMRGPSPATPQDGVGPGRSGDKYDLIDESGFLAVKDAPLSTFSIDVDTAVYAKRGRTFWNTSALPPPDAVRIEELVNYFDVCRTPARTTSTRSPSTSRPPNCPWQPKHRLVRFGIQGKRVDRERPASNLVFLIDVSGSMDQPNKLPLVQAALAMLVEAAWRERPRGDCRLCRGGRACACRPTAGERTSRQSCTAIERLHAGGSTNGGAGNSTGVPTRRSDILSRAASIA